MMHLFLNSLAASAGGGLTYIRNVLPHLAAKPDLRVTVAINSNFRTELCGLPRVDFLPLEISPARRFWYEQSALRGSILRSGADVLLSTGNFAVRNAPIPQILLSRNSIYTSADFYRDLRSRHEYGAWLDTKLRAILAKRSVHWANMTVAPSEAFAAELSQWTGVPILTVHHGFDPLAFARDSSPLAFEVEEKLRSAEGSLKLLFVSHYNYYRNFETLIRSLPILRDRLLDRPVKLLLTCKLQSDENPGRYRTSRVASLVKGLRASDVVVELGAIPYRQLHRLYRCADIYVTPAYTETFAHPLVEAMASGLPIVASDLAVHREICGDAAAYFSRFCSDGLADCVARVAGSSETTKRMTELGLEQSRQFSWKAHVDKILELCLTLMDSHGQ